MIATALLSAALGLSRYIAPIFSRMTLRLRATRSCRYASISRQVRWPQDSHPGEEVAYVLEGTLQYELYGGKSVTLSAGRTLFIPAGVVHSARNVGTGSASELATYVVRKDEVLVAPAK